MLLDQSSVNAIDIIKTTHMYILPLHTQEWQLIWKNKCVKAKYKDDRENTKGVYSCVVKCSWHFQACLLTL